MDTKTNHSKNKKKNLQNVQKEIKENWTKAK